MKMTQMSYNVLAAMIDAYGAHINVAPFVLRVELKGYHLEGNWLARVKDRIRRPEGTIIQHVKVEAQTLDVPEAATGNSVHVAVAIKEGKTAEWYVSADMNNLLNLGDHVWYIGCHYVPTITKRSELPPGEDGPFICRNVMVNTFYGPTLRDLMIKGGHIYTRQPNSADPWQDHGEATAANFELEHTYQASVPSEEDDRLPLEDQRRIKRLIDTIGEEK